MATMPYTTDLPPTVRQALAAVRRRLRAYVWFEGLALLVALLGAAFWIGLALDWWFEPSPAVRRVALVGLALAAFYVAYRYVLRRAFVPISDTSVALLLERRFAHLGDHVLTAVHVTHAPGRAAAYHPDLVVRTQQQAATAIADIDTSDLFRRGPLAGAVVTALALCVSIMAFAALSRESFAVWMDRIALSDNLWPRRVQLDVVGFPQNTDGRRVEKIAQEDDYELVVRAKLAGFVAPDTVEIRTRTSERRRARDTLTRVGDAVPGRDEFQLYRYQFKRVAGDLSFDVVGGDDHVRNLELRVVERPELFSLELACEYPDYLKRAPRTLPVTGGMRIPEGTRLTLHASSTKPLVASQIHTTARPQEVELSFASRPQNSLAWEYGTLTSDDALLVNVTDTDDVAAREPYRVSLSVVPDELPQVAVRLAGIGTAITPEARIPFAGKVSDEYGLNQAWFEYQINGEAPMRRELAQQPAGQPEVTTIDTFDTRAIDPATGERLLLLEPKQRFTITLKATDQYNLSDVSRAGSSQPFTLDVVTVPELLGLLERRELELRQRFEAIYEKVTDTRNLLSRVEFNQPGDPDGSPTAGAPSQPDAAAARKNVTDAGETDAGNEDKSTSPGGDQALVRRRLRVAGSLQNVQQSADEVLGVAESFDDIYSQITNNRIDNQDLKNRIQNDIAKPLHSIGENRMPELAAQVQLIQTHIEDAQAGVADTVQAVALADAVLVDMKHVLDRMLELETYNEVISQLRGIINDQEEINRRTKERQRDRLRDLFEESDK